MRKRYLLVFLAFLLISPPGILAEQGQGEASESVRERLDRLQQELDDLKREHEAQIRKLEEELATQKEEPAAREESRGRAGPPHQAAPVGSYGGIMNPDISVIADVQALFTNNREDDNRNKVRVKHLEFAFQGYLYPGIRADIVPALEMEYEGDDVNVEIDLEEAYLTASQVPYVSEYVPLELQIGRKFMNFGRLNAIHSHHWAFADMPLVSQNFFGPHAWYDDGIQGSLTVPNPWDLYLKTTFGYWNGRRLGHAHAHHGDGDDHENDHDNGHGEPVEWDGRVFLSRTVLGLPFGRASDLLLGCSVSWDESGNTSLVGGDLTFTHRFPGTYRRLRWQNEFMSVKTPREGEEFRRHGGYSLLTFSLGRYWETGGRYDRSQILDPRVGGDEWASSGFITYYLTHSLYARGQYRFRRMVDGDEEHNGYLQLVFGLGPHSHRLED